MANESNSERVRCQVCGRQLVPLKGGEHRNHKPPGSRGRDADRCQGSGYRAARWPVGQRLVHHAGTLWEVIEDRGGRWGDYILRRLPGGPSWINERHARATVAGPGTAPWGGSRSDPGTHALGLPSVRSLFAMTSRVQGDNGPTTR
jgi:hypothetical protein